MAVTVEEWTPGDIQSLGTAFMRILRLNLDSNYAGSGGEDLTLDQLGFEDPANDLLVRIESRSGYALRWAAEKLYVEYGGGPAPTLTGTVDYSASAATIGQLLYVVPESLGGLKWTGVAESSATGLIKDGDVSGMAAAGAVKVYVVLDEEEFIPGYALGHLEFVSPTTADGSATVFNGGPTVKLTHDAAAATNGVVVRAIAAGGGLEATIAGSGRTILVTLSDGQFLNIADSTTGSTPEVYFDEDAANTYQRLIAEAVDNMDEPHKLYEGVGATISPGPAGGSRLLQLVSASPDGVYGKGTVGSGGPEFTVVHDVGAAAMVGASLLYVQAAGAGFNAALPSGENGWIRLDNGMFIPVAYAASPAGVQTYWDPDAASAHLRMVGVIADAADETYTTATDRFEGAGSVATGTDLSGLTDIFCTVIGKRPIEL